MLATTQGKEHALAELAKRREANKDKPEFDNSKLFAGSPMYFPCNTCGELISVPEDYVTRPKHCRECAALIELGWME